jgi:hypothetical protein
MHIDNVYASYLQQSQNIQNSLLNTNNQYDSSIEPIITRKRKLQQMNRLQDFSPDNRPSHHRGGRQPSEKTFSF